MTSIFSTVVQAHLQFVQYIVHVLLDLGEGSLTILKWMGWCLMHPLWLFFLHGPQWFGSYGGWHGLSERAICEILIKEANIDLHQLKDPDAYCNERVLSRFHEMVGAVCMICLPIIFMILLQCILCRVCLVRPTVRQIVGQQKENRRLMGPF